jgi:transcription initiation factor TFIID subunit 1, fungi type
MSDRADVAMRDEFDAQVLRDNELISGLLSASVDAGGEFGLFDLNRPLELGEKADDAVDYEDLSDDDLPGDEPGTTDDGVTGLMDDGGPGLTDDGGTSHDTDYLFGDGRDSSPFDGNEVMDGVQIQPGHDLQSSQLENSHLSLPPLNAIPSFRDINFDPEPKPSGAGNQDLSIPAPAESAADLLKQSWPTFEKGKVINWTELLPPKKAHYIPKKPGKPPKPLNPTKVSLDLAPDQEKAFRLTGTASLKKRQRINEAGAIGLVTIDDELSDGSSDDHFDWETPDPDEATYGLTWADIELACEDWESRIEGTLKSESPKSPNPVHDEETAWLTDVGLIPAKPEKVKHYETDVLSIPCFLVPSFDDFERATSHLAKRVVFDLNDPHLLVDIHEVDMATKRLHLGGNFKCGENGSPSKGLRLRFNISNDEAYDALKENHQSKVRAVIGNITVEHSLPAQKLQWPYYRVKLHTREARSYHRPALKFNRFLNHVIYFSKPAQRKRKHMKGLSTDEIFRDSRDLSLADNSTAMLLEYSEEHPTVLSNFGMGNKIINYYRRKDAEDSSRPKLDVGETSVLLPEDRSPFAQFGNVNPGETVPTLHNAMFRAPVFRHEPKHTDFLVIRSTTGVAGSSWHLRNIDNVFVVGQQFPSMEIPGPNSRKVTNAAKNRMKMIAFRKIRHSTTSSVKIDEVTAHIQDSSDMQNRQKLKEFLKYHKEEKVWRVKPGDTVPDEATVRSWVKPEDVCTIDAMQVGLRHLEDAGYGKIDQGEDEEEEQEGDSLEQRLAPWKTSKNFLDASNHKAMLQLHGEGDPSGCGLAFSFIKTSMKGGFLDAIQGPLATSADAIARERKANGGHKYNVDKQNQAYAEAIRDIWEKQKTNLADGTEHPENEHENEPQFSVEDSFGVTATPHSAATPAAFDDSASQISRFSTGSRQGRTMRIIRQVRNKSGVLEEATETVRDSRVWREYLKRRHALDSESLK